MHAPSAYIRLFQTNSFLTFRDMFIITSGHHDIKLRGNWCPPRIKVLGKDCKSGDYVLQFFVDIFATNSLDGIYYFHKWELPTTRRVKDERYDFESR